MRKHENECVGCPSEMGCIGNACVYKNVPRDYCDICGEPAKYKIDGDDFCEDHANEHILYAFENMSIKEKAEAVGFDISEAC